MLVSVGMPVFNGENYVKDMLDSLMRQTYISFRQIRMMCGFRIRFRCRETELLSEETAAYYNQHHLHFRERLDDVIRRYIEE